MLNMRPTKRHRLRTSLPITQRFIVFIIIIIIIIIVNCSLFKVSTNIVKLTIMYIMTNKN